MSMRDCFALLAMTYVGCGCIGCLHGRVAGDCFVATLLAMTWMGVLPAMMENKHGMSLRAKRSNLRRTIRRGGNRDMTGLGVSE